MNNSRLPKPLSLKPPPRPQMPVSPQKIRSMIPPTAPGPAPGPAIRKPSATPQNVDPRRYIVDQIIRDCYSKQVVQDGRSVLEIRYNTHFGIREYSQFPQAPPPQDVPPSQLGTVKNRIIVLCTKQSGRVLLQKGKYNDAKHLYQVGRLWDLDELRYITRTSADSLVILLNKDYYWKSAEGPERMMKFVHHLASIHAKFTGRYPQFRGFSLQELGLPPLANLTPAARDSSVKPTPLVPSDPLIHQRMPPRVPEQREPQPIKASVQKPPMSDAASHYKDIDFTVNGNIPMKPMLAMDVDRPSSREDQSGGYNAGRESVPVETARGRGSHTASTPSAEISLPDTRGFTFGAERAPDHEKTSTLSEYARATGSTLPLRKYRSDPRENHFHEIRNVSEPLESAAAYGLQLSEHLEAGDSQSEDMFAQRADDHHKSDLASSDRASAVEHSLAVEARVDSTIKNDEPFLEESTHLDGGSESVIDTSIREIEDFMDTEFRATRLVLGASRAESHAEAERQLTEGQITQENLPEALPANSIVSLDDVLDSESIVDQGADLPLTVEDEFIPESKFEKDPEVDELLDEIGWNLSDGSDALVKKLTAELAITKRKNIAELVSLDFGKDTLSNEVAVANGEVENLFAIFKKMEVQFNMIDPQVNEIENNSRGLQVETVNKKLLYNELSSILTKVRVNPEDLEAVATFVDFKNLEAIPLLEQKLLVCYGAFKTFGGASEDNFSKMQALKECQIKYERASNSFVHNFSEFISCEFKDTVAHLSNDISSLSSRDLYSSLQPYVAYFGISNFVRCVSLGNLDLLADRVKTFLASYLNSVFNARLEAARLTSPVPSRLSQTLELGTGARKSKLGRFGSTRLMNRLSSEDTTTSRSIKQLEGVHKDTPGEIVDSKAIMSLVRETREFILIIQFILGLFFHLSSPYDYDEALKHTTFEQRMEEFENSDLQSVNYKTDSNDLLRFMTTVFGDYINRFIKNITPAELIIPQLLVELQAILIDATSKDQDFIGFGFIGKVIDRYKRSWGKLISQQIDLLNKCDIRAKGGILPVVRNINHIILSTETTLEETLSYRDGQDAQLEVERFIHGSYSDLTKAMVDLFSREDPLLKYNAHDEKERAHRNIAILQNDFMILQQLEELGTARVAPMKRELGTLFIKVQKEYFNYIIHRYFNKMAEFIYAHGENVRRTKNDKILVKSLASTHTNKDIQPKIVEIHRKMERHIVTLNSVFEQDLLKRLLADIEAEISQLFMRFDQIVRQEKYDVAPYVTPIEIRRFFISVHNV